MDEDDDENNSQIENKGNEEPGFDWTQRLGDWRCHICRILLSMPFIQSLNLSFLTKPSIALTAWRNCTGYRSIIASSSKSPSWHIELSRHPNPPYLQHLLFHRHTSGLRSSSTIQLHQPVHKSSLINRGFSHASPAVWNALPPQVRDQPSLELFKRHLKTHLFRTPTWS